MTINQTLAWLRICNRMRVARGHSPHPEDAASVVALKREIEKFDRAVRPDPEAAAA